MSRAGWRWPLANIAILRWPEQLACEELGIRKEEIERRQPWQLYIETNFNVQRRMADWYFAKTNTWAELAAPMPNG
jgi:hypothetical protein